MRIQHVVRKITILGVGLCFAAVAAGQEAKGAKKEEKAPAKAAAAKAPAKKAAPTGHLMAAGDLKWKDGGKGVSQSVLWGDPNTGAYGAIDKFAAGTDMGIHTHSSEARAVVISGTAVMTLRGGAAKELGPGSYIHTLGKEVHSTKCKEGADCVLFIMQSAKFDMTPVKAQAKK
jgi:quercetin dioxygenase-like cupin family protein